MCPPLSEECHKNKLKTLYAPYKRGCVCHKRFPNQHPAEKPPKEKQKEGRGAKQITGRERQGEEGRHSGATLLRKTPMPRAPSFTEPLS